ncbi:hypothetical protein N7468_000076 [Penicillium chermesinum]|uniref:Uncharacterized protein n=1 Tax=Penicillium chermesinum TaxID=63820 RepID=A0A9W9PJJ0_9EURO|nr:uncharacterized protein N7468_000076 [Penicillium chermesinum]KAJ5248625.1 hypothetical protein N7468_000076 [Penicillium chermesinum]KAJ6150734.1 hypothetical protein N7470_007328 [Penicillium chermesinum]
MRFHALIRTHHITSRKKVGVLKRAADTHQCLVLLRSGGCPGIMYVEGPAQAQVDAWVGVVRKLRYKDFQLVMRSAQLIPEGPDSAPAATSEADPLDGSLREIDSVKEFGEWMARRRVWHWWRRGMGYA